VHPSLQHIFWRFFFAAFVGGSSSSSSFGGAFRFFVADTFLLALAVVRDVPS